MGRRQKAVGPFFFLEFNQSLRGTRSQALVKSGASMSGSDICRGAPVANARRNSHQNMKGARDATANRCFCSAQCCSRSFKHRDLLRDLHSADAADICSVSPRTNPSDGKPPKSRLASNP